MTTDSPLAASAWVAKLPPGRDRYLQMNRVATMWYEQDSEAATAWAESLGATKVLEQLKFTAAYKATSEDPFAVTSVLDSLPLGEQRLTVLRSIIDRASKVDFDRTVALIDSLPEREQLPMRLKLARELADDAKVSPDKALDYLAGLPPGVYRAERAKYYASYLAEKDPAALLEWIAEHPDLLDQEQMLEAAAQPWVNKDLEGAQDTLLNMPNSSASQELASAVGRKLLASDPQVYE